jgi:phosphotransferase system HPr (HPr) family protein
MTRRKNMSKDVVVQMDDGMEPRPIALLVQTANRFSSQIYLRMDNVRVNAKSIMGMMNLALLNGASVTIEAEGADEEDAVTEIQRFLTRR